MTRPFVLAALFFTCLTNNTQASSTYTLTENFGAEKLVIQFEGGLINGSSTLLGVTAIDDVFINGVGASNNGNSASFTEQLTSSNSANAQIDLSNPTASNFYITEIGTTLKISQFYSSSVPSYFHDTIQTETGSSTLFLNSSLTTYNINNSPIQNTVSEPSAIALLLIGFAGLVKGKFGAGLRKA